jgi:hypothetical protein
MKRMTRIAGGVFLLAVMTGPGTANAAETFHYNLGGNAINGFMFAATDDGCVLTGTSISYGDVYNHTNGPPQRTHITLIELNYVDQCTGESYILDGGSDEIAAKFTGNLGRASIAGTIPVTDGTVTATVTLDLTYDATGDLGTIHGLVFNSNGDGVVFHQEQNLATRSAQASGTATGTFELPGGTTTIPLILDPVATFDSAQLGKVQGGTVVITK